MKTEQQLLEKLYRILKDTDNGLDRFEFSIVVMGTHALRAAGIEYKEPGDLDIAMTVREELMPKLKGYLSAYQAMTKCSNGYHDEKQYSIKIEDCKVDIWLYDSKKWEEFIKETSPFIKNEIMYASVKSTLEAKKKYHRNKDLIDILEIQKWLIQFANL